MSQAYERSQNTKAHPSAYFGMPVAGFCSLSPDAILGQLATASQFDIDVLQREAWLQEIAILQGALREGRSQGVPQARR